MAPDEDTLKKKSNAPKVEPQRFIVHWT